MASRPYTSDPNGQRMYDGDDVWMVSEADDVTPVYGTLKLNPPDDNYKWSVIWKDLGELYWTGIRTLYKGGDPTNEEDSLSDEDIPPVQESDNSGTDWWMNMELDAEPEP